MKDKIHIVLACSAGMSTSLLVKKMQESAEKEGQACEIKAIPIAAIDQTVEEERVDILLLGPQVRFKKAELSQELAPKGIKVDVIDMSDYGLLKGDKVLHAALAELGEA